MKNILHMSETSEPGGSETVLATMASSLDPDKYRSHVCLLEEGWLTDHLSQLGICYRILENRWAYDPIFLARLVRLIREKNIDLVHSHEFMMNVYGAVAARLCGIRMIGTLHGKVYFTEKRTRTMAYKLALALCTNLIAVSEDLKMYFVRHLGLKADRKILTIYNGIDLSRYKVGDWPADTARELNAGPDTLLVGSVGSLFEVKGYEYLLTAAKQVAEAVPGFRLFIAGVGHLESSLRELAQSLDVSDRVRFLGFRRDVPKLLNLLDVYVCSSVSEGLSLSILEAMAAGRPVVAANVGGNPELITDGYNGLLVPPKNPEALADKLIYLLRNKELRVTMGQASRRITEEKFSLETMMQNYYRLYENLIG